jgi:hypothetical protein
MSQLLDLHLTRAIARHKPEAPVSKFLQLADAIEADLKEMDAEADVLNEKRLANKELARQIFNHHHEAQDRVAKGLERMGAVVHDMSGSNSRGSTEKPVETTKLGEGSGATPETFPAVGEVAVDGEVIDTSNSKG